MHIHCCSDFRYCVCGIVVYVLFSKHFRRLWIRHRVPREGIRCVVEDSFDPFCSEVVANDPGFEALELRVFYLIKAVVVKDWDEWVVICDNFEVW